MGRREAALVDDAPVVVRDPLDDVALDAADRVGPGHGEGAVDRVLTGDAVDRGAPLGADVERPTERPRARLEDGLVDPEVGVDRVDPVDEGQEPVVDVDPVAADRGLVAPAVEAAPAVEPPGVPSSSPGAAEQPAIRTRSATKTARVSEATIDSAMTC